MFKNRPNQFRRFRRLRQISLCAASAGASNTRMALSIEVVLAPGEFALLQAREKHGTTCVVFDVRARSSVAVTSSRQRPSAGAAGSTTVGSATNGSLPVG